MSIEYASNTTVHSTYTQCEPLLAISVYTSLYIIADILVRVSMVLRYSADVYSRTLGLGIRSQNVL